MSDEAERTLDFAGALAELQGLVGKRVSVESAPEGAGPFHESRGVLGRSIDLQIESGWPLDRPARVAFFLDDAEAQFVVRESGFVIAIAYTLALADGQSRTVQMHYSGGAVLIIREELG
ncbi:MAG: hypothetical protein ACRDLO_09395 [Solirubrobacterales bacterium]